MVARHHIPGAFAAKSRIMRRTTLLIALFIGFVLALAPGMAEARAGFGGSMGSRGGMTFSRPPATNTAPAPAAPIERSLTPQGTPTPAPGYSPGYARPYGGGSPFMSGLLGGLIGAGIGGLLFGHGMFYGISGFGSFLGFLLQIFLLVLLGRWLWRLFTRQTAFAGGNFFARSPMDGMRPQPMGGSGAPAGVAPIAIGPSDYQQFERLLHDIQAAWSAQNLHGLQTMATPEMVSYFAEQMADQASRGVCNEVSDVRLEQGDLAEAWAEHGREYATVAMRFSMVDVTRDATGRVVDGDLAVRTMATELWTFVRAPGGHWLLSAIQQSR
jgi:predicted lipid-binding transport protein (Tim44 family)